MPKTDPIRQAVANRAARNTASRRRVIDDSKVDEGNEQRQRVRNRVWQAAGISYDKGVVSKQKSPVGKAKYEDEAMRQNGSSKPLRSSAKGGTGKAGRGFGTPQNTRAYTENPMQAAAVLKNAAKRQEVSAGRKGSPSNASRTPGPDGVAKKKATLADQILKAQSGMVVREGNAVKRVGRRGAVK